jgi:RND superfamily putative drug exporter
MAVNAAPSREAPAGRLAGQWVPWLVIGWWVALAVVMVPLSGMLSSVTTDSAADTLPASAGSTKVAVLEDSLPGGDDNTLVFMYHRAGGMTEADRTTVETLHRRQGDDVHPRCEHDLRRTGGHRRPVA